MRFHSTYENPELSPVFVIGKWSAKAIKTLINLCTTNEEIINSIRCKSESYGGGGFHEMKIST